MMKNNALPDMTDIQYIGEWVVFCDNKLIAHNKDLSKLEDVINNCKKIPTIAKIPDGDVLIF